MDRTYRSRGRGPPRRARPEPAHPDRRAAPGSAPRDAHPRRLSVGTGDEGTVDVRERGANQQISDRRLYMQLQVFTGCTDGKPLVDALEASGVEAVLYEDVNDPRGVGVLTMSEDPTLFVTGVRDLLNRGPFAGLPLRPELTMMGRTYASGFEADLDEWLLRRPRRTALNPAWPWGIWYPLRRTGRSEEHTSELQSQSKP